MVHERLRPLFDPSRVPAFQTLICGHRGASATAPENTLSAFRSAVDAGCDLVELDVLLTRDNRLVVIHDTKLNRTTDRAGRVRQLTLQEVQSCDAGRWFTESFAGERIPKLEEALACVRGSAIPMIEIKQSLLKDPEILPRLVGNLQATGMDDRAVIIVWDADSIEVVRKRLPHAVVALVTFTRLGIRRAAAQGFDGVVSYHRSTTRRLVDEAHEAGLFVAPWTVNAPREMESFCRSGVDIIITDLPHVLRDLLERLELERTRDFLLDRDSA